MQEKGRKSEVALQIFYILGDFTLHIIGGQNGSLPVARIDEQEFALEHLKAGHDEACGTGLGDGTCVEIVDLHGAVEIEIKTHGG